jgi:hypothetical protein
MTNTQNDTSEALRSEKRELALYERLAGHGYHDLRHRPGALPEAGPETTGKHNALHG